MKTTNDFRAHPNREVFAVRRTRLPRAGFILALALGLAVIDSAFAGKASDGFLRSHGRKLFPIGSYELPKTDADLRALADAGFNLVQCRNAAELDRARAAGLLGWVNVPLQLGAESEAMRKAVEAVRDHPALAVWEGPDEVVWNFTAYSGLFRSGVYKHADEWWQQTPFAVERSEAEAAKILSKLRESCNWIRRVDRRQRPIWINEAAQSDLKFIREYLDDIDITGCDNYPIHDLNRVPAAVGDYTDRYQRIGRGKPVWMVLQGFSWHELTPPKDERLVYPTFLETRLMAYIAIAHGAKGILYWGTEFVPQNSPFRQSLLAIAGELSALQPFLTAKEERGVRLALTESKGRPEPGSRGVRLVARRAGRDWLIALVNEDNYAHMGVELTGLGRLNGQNLDQLYGPEVAVVKRGGFVTRVKPNEVKVFATSRKWETARRSGREFE